MRSRLIQLRCGIAIIFVSTVVAAMLGPASGAGAEQPSPLNVLLICVDDLKPTLACYGDRVAVTPAMDRLAARGVLFEMAYCNQAVCAPSRNSLMTGLRPQTIGVYDLATYFRNAAPDAVTLGQHFRRHGYHTQALGKIYHTGHGNQDDSDSWDVPSMRPKGPTYALPSAERTRVDPRGNERGPATESADVDDDHYADGKVATEAISRIESAAAKKGQPFLIAVGFIRPHLPFVAPRKYWDLYDPAKLPMPETTVPPELAPAYAPTSFGELRNYAGIPKTGPIDEELTRHLIHGYYAATSYTDAQIGRVLDALDASEAADNTIVVLWGDHGWHLGDHGMWCKHTNYEQAARIPLIVSAPGRARGAKAAAMVETVDIYPTLAEFAGVAAPQQLDGVSFAPVLQTPTASARESVIHVYPRGNRLGRAIRTERYRLVEWKPIGAAAASAEYELYDYQDDPLETRNIASDQPEVTAKLVHILATHPEPKPAWKPARN
jgi:iduronate 2-sulfatase